MSALVTGVEDATDSGGGRRVDGGAVQRNGIGGGVAVLEFSKPPWGEVASVAGLAVRLYLGGTGAPRRYFAWGQAVRRAVLTLTMLKAVWGLDVLLLTAWSRRVFSWLPVPPAGLVAGTPAGVMPPAVWWLVAYAWIVSFVALALGHRVRVGLVAALIVTCLIAIATHL